VKALAGLALVGALAAACTGSFDGGGGPAAGGSGDDGAAGRVSSPVDGSIDDAGNGSAGDPADGGGAPADAPNAANPPTDAAVVPATDGGVVCQTTIDSYGYTRCTCATGVAALGDAGVASCAGFDCCVRYGADSGLAAGFGDPALSSGLCGCFQSADIAALLGANASCQNFASDGVGKVVTTCP
jgi:hypothetical protein